MSQVARMKIEAMLKGKKLPFDDQVLEYLLSIAAAGDASELLELMEDFCPKWSKTDRISLVAHLKTIGGRPGDEGSRDFPSLTPGTAGGAVSSRAVPAAVPAVPAGSPGAVPPGPSDADHLAADMLLAQMLQEEEDARAALNNPAPSANAKKGKKAFRTLNINYTVARGGNAGPALGTAAPSSLADVLRQKRSQQVLDTGPPSLATGHGPGGPGPATGPGRPGPWAPGGGGLSWAERVQMNQEPEPQGDAAVPILPAAGSRALHPLKVRVRSAQAEHHIEAQPKDTVGDVKSRLEKMHGITFSLQRLLHAGRELKDHESLQPMSDSQHQIYLQLYMREGPPKGFVQTIQVQLHLPGSESPTATTVPEKITGNALKEQIEKDHGIRKEHLHLTFFGHPLRDDLSISQQGVAAGGRITVSIKPAPADPSTSLAVMQTTPHGRVLDESEAVQAAMHASMPSANGVSGAAQVNGHQQDLDEDHLGAEDLAMDLANESEVGDFIKDVAAQEPRQSGVVNQAKAIASHYRLDDYIGRVSKRGGYRLTLLMHKSRKDKVMGFLVFRFRARSLLVLQLAVARDARGRGAGRALLRWAAKEAQRANMDSIMVSSWPYGPALFSTLGFTEIMGMDGEDVRGQVWELQVKVKPKRGGGDPGAALHSRKDVVRAVFHALNRSGSGLLSSAEMKPFAEQTGFDGSDEDWHREFEALKQDCGVSEVGFKEFDHLVNDQSDSGCYCSDAELRSLLQSLPPVQRQARAPAATGPPPQPPPPAGPRLQLIRRAFAALNGSGSGQLSAQEMRPFAEQTGFQGTDQEWQAEYELLTNERGVSAISFKDFESLVNDESDAGCYCSDSDLQRLLDTMPGDPRAPETAVPPRDSGSVPHFGNGDAGPEPARSQLISRAFHALNTSGTGHLSGLEMKPFAEQTGFDGTDADWEKEFALLKQECNMSQITLQHFEKLVNDESDNGCYCSDGDLETLLQTLSQRAPAAQAPSPVPNGHGRAASREQLITQAFGVLNHSGSGQLSAHEMRPFAELTGFEGSDDEWRQEFELLRQECNGGQVTLQEFLRLANDESEEGCYCSDSDLRSLVEKHGHVPNGRDFPSRPPAAPAPPSAPTSSRPAPVPEPASQADQSGTSGRDVMIKMVFDGLNRSGSGYLNAAEMRPVADLTGFEGSVEDWQEEFRLLRQECDGSKPGIGFRDFRRLVNDDSENGCYCSDMDLRKLNEGVNPEVVHMTVQATVPEPERQDQEPERDRLILSVFQVLNRSGSGYLSSAEMRPIADLTGFEGPDVEWQEEFRLLRQECDASKPGIGFNDFQRLLEDRSDNGCFCPSDELRKLLDSRPAAQAAPAAAPAAAQAAPVPAEAAPEATAAVSARGQLLQQTFTALNRSGSGHLSAQEMRPFAELTGFNGTDSEWREEFRLLRQECGGSQPGILFKDFERLANDQSEDGCYCSDKTLRSFLEGFPAAPWQGAQPSQAREPPARPKATAPAADPRQELITQTFAALNRSGSGQLSAQEMRPFAELTGFTGTDREWQEEFDLLRQECNRGRVDFNEFQRLINDQSDNGCYATNEDLQSLLSSKSKSSGHGSASSSTQRVAPTEATNCPPASNGAPPRSERGELVAKAFAALNGSGSGQLSAQEMRPFADLTGFAGTDAEWQQEYDLLRQECAYSQISFADFARLVDDQTDDGCYASDKQLQQLLASLARQNAQPQEPPARSERQSWIHRLFAALNRSGSGNLSADEMRPFANETGFQGSNDEWLQEFNLLRKECHQGQIRLDDFERLVNDESEEGCYVTDQELRRMLELLSRVGRGVPGVPGVFRPPPGLHPPNR